MRLHRREESCSQDGVPHQPRSSPPETMPTLAGSCAHGNARRTALRHKVNAALRHKANAMAAQRHRLFARARANAALVLGYDGRGLRTSTQMIPPSTPGHRRDSGHTHHVRPAPRIYNDPTVQTHVYAHTNPCRSTRWVCWRIDPAENMHMHNQQGARPQDRNLLCSVKGPARVYSKLHVQIDPARPHALLRHTSPTKSAVFSGTSRVVILRECVRKKNTCSSV